jgi:hypothetical protein
MIPDTPSVSLTGIRVYCADYRCRHSIAMSAD